MWTQHNLIANPEPRPIDLLIYRTSHLESQVKRLKEDMEYMKTEFKKIMDDKAVVIEKIVVVEKSDPEISSWWFY
jgi:hypothetical protein